jgi:hypothetical protein
LAVGTDVDNTTLQQLAAGSEIADLAWEAPDELAADHAQVFQDAMRAHHGGDSERAGRLWENLQATWSQAWSANYAVLEFMQGTGLTRVAPVKPQRWVVASFEHHASPHGLPRPHVHNIVLTSYRPVVQGALCGFGQALVAGTGNAGHGSRSFPGFRYTGLLHNRRNGLSRAERADYGCHGP